MQVKRARRKEESESIDVVKHSSFMRELRLLRAKQRPIIAKRKEEQRYLVDNPKSIPYYMPQGEEEKGCYWCGMSFRTHSRALKSTREHIIPKLLGGSNEMSNIAFSHSICNSRRGHDSSWVPYHEHKQLGQWIRFKQAKYERIY